MSCGFPGCGCVNSHCRWRWFEVPGSSGGMLLLIRADADSRNRGSAAGGRADAGTGTNASP